MFISFNLVYKMEKEQFMKISRRKINIILSMLLCAILIVWTAWGNKALVVSEFTISSGRIPDAFSGFRIVHISDLHNGEFGKNNEELLRLMSESKPDIIVITGDLIDADRTNMEIALCFAQESVKIAPTYYVTGNHEAASSQRYILQDGLEAAGVIALEDKIIYLEREGEEIALVGLADPNFTPIEDRLNGVPDMISAKLENLIGDESRYTILLTHRPELFETYVDAGIDLAFSGHAHGGQFRLPFIGGLYAPNQGFFPKYDAGIYIDGNTNMVLSRGIGRSSIPFRFNNRPEVVVVELQ